MPVREPSASWRQAMGPRSAGVTPDWTYGLGRQPDAPVGRSGRLLLEGAAQQDRNLFVRDRARPSGAKLVVEPLEAMLHKALPPLAHRRPGSVQALADLLLARPPAAHNTN